MKFAFVLVGLLTLSATGEVAHAVTSGPATPVEILDRGLTALTGISATAPFTKRYAQLEPIVDQTFNLGEILKAVIGPRWATLPPDQQRTLFKAFRSYTVANYVANFSGGNDTIIKMLPGTETVSDGQMVPTQIAGGTGEPTKINYLVKRTDNEWRINDIYLDGTISQVAVQRSDFRRLVSSNNDAAPLIEQLNKKVTDLSGGAVKPEL